MHSRTIIFIVYHVIGVPLFVLYVIQLVLLKIRPEFSSTFYTFFFFGGIIDLIFYFINIFVYQFAFLPGVYPFFERFRVTSKNDLWKQYSWMLSIISVIMFYLPGIQDVVNLMIAFNRFCALCAPVLYRKIFTRLNTYLMIPFALIYSIIFAFPNIGAFSFVVNIAENGTEPVYLITAAGIKLISQSTWTMIITFTDSCICLLLYCVIAVWMMKIKKKTNAAELRMVMLGFAILLTNIPSVLYQLSWKIFGWNFNDIIYQTLPWVILIKSLSPPLLLIATNENMRRQLTFLLPAKLRPIDRKSINFEATTSVLTVTPAIRIVCAPP